MRRVSRSAAVVIAAGAMLALVAVMPLLLNTLLPGGDADWARLSDIGEAYGSISALLSAAALITVGLSLRAQTRQLRASHVQTFGESQSALLRAVMDQPRVYGPILLGREIDDAETEVRVRQRLFLVLMLRYNWAMYEAGAITDSALRDDALGETGRGPRARDIWQEIRPFWLANVGQWPRGRRFIAILDEAFTAPLAPATPAPITSRTTPPTTPPAPHLLEPAAAPPAPRGPTPAALAAAAGAGAVVAWLAQGRAGRRGWARGLDRHRVMSESDRRKCCATHGEADTTER